MTEIESDDVYGMKEQIPLFSDYINLPNTLPLLSDLRPTKKMLRIFEDLHNFIYANEGFLKEKIFHEIVKLISIKIFDEQSTLDGKMRFGITADEYLGVEKGINTTFVERIRLLLKQLSDSHRQLLIGDNFEISDKTLARVVATLQYVSFLQTQGDIKGEAFQTFISRYQRGDRGEFFTPPPIVKLAIDVIAPRPDERVIDPACGSGGFLFQCVKYLSKESDFQPDEYLLHKVRAIEFNPDIALTCMVRFALSGGTGNEVLCENALIPKQELDETFDIVVTNPPFGNKGKVEDLDILSSYTIATHESHNGKGNYGWVHEIKPQTPEVLFIERSFRLLIPGGRLAIVLPDGILQNSSSKYVRDWMLKRFNILAVFSFPHEAFLPYGTGIKTSLLIAQKKPGQLKPVFMAAISNVGYDAKGNPVYKYDDSGLKMKDISPQADYVLEEDISSLAKMYHLSSSSNKEIILPKNAFVVPQEKMNHRLDVDHYHPSLFSLLTKAEGLKGAQLSSLCTFIQKEDSFRKVPSQEIQYIAISEVDFRLMQVVSTQRIKAYEAPSRASYILATGDIITAISGANTGTEKQATAFITPRENGCICSNGFAVLRNFTISPFYLLAFMRSRLFYGQVKRMMTGHTIPTISIKDLGKIIVPILPATVVKDIAKITQEYIIGSQQIKELYAEVELLSEKYFVQD